jgi:hypothetical protein
MSRVRRYTSAQRVTSQRAARYDGRFVGHLERHSEHLERQFLRARKIAQHPRETAFNIVGSSFTIRRESRSTCVGIRIGHPRRAAAPTLRLG